MGSAADALENSKVFHRRGIPDDDTEGEKDTKKIFSSILNFLGAKSFTSKEVPPMFTGLTADSFEAAAFALENFAVDSAEEYNAFKLYPIDLFFFLLHKKFIQTKLSLYMEIEKPLHSVPYAKFSFDRFDEFQYNLIGCEFHNEEDFPNLCSLSKVQRWAFVIAKFCADKRYPQTPGQHFPANYQASEGEISAWSSSSEIWDESKGIRNELTPSSSMTTNAANNCGLKPSISSISWIDKFRLKHGIKSAKVESKSSFESTTDFKKAFEEDGSDTTDN